MPAVAVPAHGPATVGRPPHPMTDAETLLLILAVVYLSECLIWVRRDAVAFITALGRRVRIVHPGGLLANDRGGLLLAPPLPPLGRLYLTQPWPLSVTAEGVLGWVAPTLDPEGRPPQEGRFVAFAELGKTGTDGKRLLVDGRPFARLSSPVSARRLAALIDQWLRLDSGEREAAIDAAVAETFDDGEIERRLVAERAAGRWTRGLANGLFAALFGLAPPVSLAFGFTRVWLGLAVVIAGLVAAVLVAFRRAHGILFPGRAGDRRGALVQMLLSPLGAIRAGDALSRDLLVEFHPLAVARVLCAADELRTLARRVLDDLDHPMEPAGPGGDDPRRVEVENASRRRLRRAVVGFVERCGLDPAALTAPPEPEDETMARYCPRCRRQFTAAASVCLACGGLELVEWPGTDGGTRSAGA